MSRIGKAPIVIPAGVTVQVDGNNVTVKGPKGQLSETVASDITVKVEDGHIVFDVQHFSEYVIAAERPTTPTVVTGNNNALMYGALAVVLILGMAIVMKKRKTA